MSHGVKFIGHGRSSNLGTQIGMVSWPGPGRLPIHTCMGGIDLWVHWNRISMSKRDIVECQMWFLLSKAPQVSNIRVVVLH